MRKIGGNTYQPVANNILGSLYDPGPDFLKDKSKYNELIHELELLEKKMFQ